AVAPERVGEPERHITAVRALELVTIEILPVVAEMAPWIGRERHGRLPQVERRAVDPVHPKVLRLDSSDELVILVNDADPQPIAFVEGDIWQIDPELHLPFPCPVLKRMGSDFV